MTRILCFVCKLVFSTVKDFLLHFKLRHFSQHFDSFSCTNEACLRDFKSFRTFKDHITKCFAVDDNTPNLTVDRDREVGNISGADQPELLDRMIDEPAETQGPNAEIVNVSSSDLKSALSQAELACVAKLYASPLVNRATVQSIVEIHSEFLSSGFLEILKSKVFLLLDDPNPSDFDKQELSAMFDILSKPFDGLETEHLRFGALRETSAFIEPTKELLGSEYVPEVIDGELNMSHRKVFAQHISISEVLIKLLELPDALEITLNNLNSLLLCKEPFTNFVQGRTFQSLLIRPEFQNKIVLPIFLYFDDFEPDNSLGSHAGHHKLGSVCFSVPCLPAGCLSSQDGIFQTDLFLSENKVFGNAKLFKKTIDELILLETEGIVVKGKRLYFCLCQVIGDNLGVHEITGFVMGFTANYACRHCKVHQRTMQTQINLDRDVMRTSANYKIDVSIKNPSLTGVREECVFNRVPSYDQVSRPFADLFHDFSEGGSQYGMYHVIQYLVFEKKYISLDDLNFRIEYFDYGSVEYGNVIPRLSLDPNSKKIKLSGSEMLCLVRYFGLMVGDYVPPEDAVWHFYLVLREIVSIVHSPFVIRAQMPYLSSLITEHHELYLSLFKDNLKFKHHMWLHYPDLLLDNGPMIHTSSLILERHHRPSKQIARASNSRVNLPYTVSMKEQLRLSARLLSQKPLTSPPLLGPSSLLPVSLLVDFNRFSHVLPEVLSSNPLSKVLSVPWVTICGTRYSEGIVVCVDYENSLPLFGSVQHIFVIDAKKDVKFVVSMFSTVGFNAHLASYEVVENSNKWAYLSQADFLLYIPANLRTGPRDGKKYITLRTELPF